MNKKKLGNITLYNCDCMDYMATCKDNEFDLAIVDPPYGINIDNNIGRRKGDKHSNHKNIKWDNEIPKNEYFNELKRISINQIIWGGNYFNMPPCKGFIIWDKLFSNDVSFSRYEYAWTSFNVTSKGFIFSPKNDKNKIHPTQKPIKLYEWLLHNYAKQGQKIFDSHFGSLSIGIACHNLGFELTTCEIDKDYYEAAKKRLQVHQMQKTIFDYIK